MPAPIYPEPTQYSRAAHREAARLSLTGLTLPTNPIPAIDARTGLAKKIKHRRQAVNKAENSPSRFYAKKPRKQPWGPPNESGKSMFQYTDHGELSLGAVYSRDEMLHYLLRHPRNNLCDGNGRRLPLKDQGLVLWIQNPPAQYTHRYGHTLASQSADSRTAPRRTTRSSKASSAWPLTRSSRTLATCTTRSKTPATRTSGVSSGTSTWPSS